MGGRTVIERAKGQERGGGEKLGITIRSYMIWALLSAASGFFWVSGGDGWWWWWWC
jgi:hypothetical protein